MGVKAGKGTKKTVEINRSNIQALIDEINTPPVPPVTPPPTQQPDTTDSPTASPSAACTDDYGLGVTIGVRGFKNDRTCNALSRNNGCDSYLKGPSGLQVFQVCRLACGRCDLQ